jgi:hypothetical protein
MAASMILNRLASVGASTRSAAIRSSLAAIPPGGSIFSRRAPRLTLGPTRANAGCPEGPTVPITTSPMVRLIRAPAPGPPSHAVSHRSRSGAARIASAASAARRAEPK